jgi:hypothetical protein
MLSWQKLTPKRSVNPGRGQNFSERLLASMFVARDNGKECLPSGINSRNREV